MLQRLMPGLNRMHFSQQILDHSLHLWLGGKVDDEHHQKTLGRTCCAYRLSRPVALGSIEGTMLPRVKSLRRPSRVEYLREIGWLMILPVQWEACGES